ncbi:unnamed protein product [Brassica rapa]|uniref:Uncharacterized protein n=1 Tax=Brassica campestris TaxID=3711 RepID=A0A3P5Y3T6_BRACM|nr:unnamed protein product [Brassica rapa]VDC62009.1 unnamed protein product [Brassica rapa]
MERLACSVGIIREMEATLDPSSPFHRRHSSFREEEVQSVPSSSAFSHGEWRLTKLRTAVVELHVFWVVAEEISFKRLNSPAGRQGGVEERWSHGGSVVSELRRNVVTVVSVGGCARMGRSSRGGRRVAGE